MTTIEHMKEGRVTHSHTEAMVTLAEKWLLEYFAAAGPRQPGELEDDFCGEPPLLEMLMNTQGRWRSSPFYPALARLVDKGKLRWWKDGDGIIWYSL